MEKDHAVISWHRPTEHKAPGFLLRGIGNLDSVTMLTCACLKHHCAGPFGRTRRERHQNKCRREPQKREISANRSSDQWEAGPLAPSGLISAAIKPLGPFPNRTRRD